MKRKIHYQYLGKQNGQIEHIMFGNTSYLFDESYDPDEPGEDVENDNV